MNSNRWVSVRCCVVFLLVAITICCRAQPSPVPLTVHAAISNQVEISWTANTNAAYQLEKAHNLLAWIPATPPLAAPTNGGSMSRSVSMVATQQFFRLRTLELTNSPVPAVPGNYWLHMTHAGIPRQYRLMVPTNYTAAVSAPLALVFHGGDQTANSFANNHPGLLHYANSNGLILVLPNSTSHERGTGWHSADPTPEFPVDDVGFALALIDRLDEALNIDRDRVYAGGFSSGGRLSHWMMARTTNVFAAVAAVGSSIGGERHVPGEITYDPPPSGPVSALIVNATNDCKRPYIGGYNSDGQLVPAAWEAVAHYTNANVCSGPGVLTTNWIVSSNIFRFEACGSKPPASQTQTNLVIREHYTSGCSPGTEVLFVTLTDGGHIWPDPGDNVGFNANREVIDFFLRQWRTNAPAPPP